jgi:hypothetical protein
MLDVAKSVLVAVVLIITTGCDQSRREVFGPLPQRGYLWQRDWTPPVIDSVLEARRRLDGIVLLGGEIDFGGEEPVLFRADIDWELLRSRQISCALALRIATYAGPFLPNDSKTRFITTAVKSLVDLAASHGVVLNEFQIDFDCAEKNLRAYRTWVRAVRKAVHPLPLVLTTLPAWLDDPEFVPLVREVERYVLQVHSVPMLTAKNRATLCDVSAAQTWVSKAARLGLPFSA